MLWGSTDAKNLIIGPSTPDLLFEWARFTGSALLVFDFGACVLYVRWTMCFKRKTVSNTAYCVFRGCTIASIELQAPQASGLGLSSSFDYLVSFLSYPCTAARISAKYKMAPLSIGIGSCEEGERESVSTSTLHRVPRETLSMGARGLMPVLPFVIPRIRSSISWDHPALMALRICANRRTTCPYTYLLLCCQQNEAAPPALMMLSLEGRCGALLENARATCCSSWSDQHGSNKRITARMCIEPWMRVAMW